MNETYVTLSGWLGGDVSLRQAGGVPVASFRVASTPRRYSRRTQSWEDADTQWYSVNTWRALADNCDRSLRRGDPVVVHGKLSARSWTNKDGVEVTSFEVEAAFVGHDLNRGLSRFERRKLVAATAGAPDASDHQPDDQPDDHSADPSADRVEDVVATAEDAA